MKGRRRVTFVSRDPPSNGGSRGADSSDRRKYIPALLGNLVPVVGTVVFGWSLTTVVFIYLIELGVMAAVHTGIALCAPHPVEETELSRVMGYQQGDDFAGKSDDDESNPIQLATRLPPIYRRNIRFLTRTLVIFPALGIIGYSLFDLLGEYPSVTPALTVAVFGVCFGQGRHAWRNWIVDRTYEQYSPAAIIAVAHELFGLYVFTVILVASSVTVVVLALAFGGVETRALLVPYLLPIALAKTYFEANR
jgi:hypothetical protein